MCAKCLPGVIVSDDDGDDDKADGGITERCMRRAEVSEVISAAEDPRPVLWTSERVTPVGLKWGMLFSDAVVRGRPNNSSYTMRNVRKGG